MSMWICVLFGVDSWWQSDGANVNIITDQHINKQTNTTGKMFYLKHNHNNQFRIYNLFQFIGIILRARRRWLSVELEGWVLQILRWIVAWVWRWKVEIREADTSQFAELEGDKSSAIKRRRMVRLHLKNESEGSEWIILNLGIFSLNIHTFVANM